MSNTIRIRTTPNGGDKYLKVKLDQEFDFIEILSLKLTQEEVYRKFCSDYGVVIGRINLNNGFGVPNAKVSIFIPLDDIDKGDPIIRGLYPYEVITDKDDDGIRYNLLPKDGDPSNPCFTPVGTFPNKREILDNEQLLDVYCKYYKFTTTTNHAGDFMIFGVPNGTYTMHVDADISDIGVASQRPYDLISQGTPQKMFYSPTKFKSDKNLDKLVQIKSMNAGVNVQPFWGDPDNCQIGITRVDFDLNYNLVPSAIFMGSIYGDQHKHSVNKRCRPRKKLGEVCEQVAGPGSVQMIRKTIDNQIEEFNVEGGRVIDDDGTWAYQIPMNLDYMVTNEFGDLVLSEDPNKGVPTRAKVRFDIGMDETGGEGRIRTRARYLVPNNPKNTSEIDYEFGQDTKETSFRDLYWNKIYSVSNFISRFQRNSVLENLIPGKSRAFTGMKDVDACAGDKTPFPYNRVDTNVNPIFFIICLIIKIVAFLVFIMNRFFIPAINLVIVAINAIVGLIVSVINGIINFICGLASIFGNCGLHTIPFHPIDPIGCVSIKCPEDDSSYFAPGCSKTGLDGGKAWTKANEITPLNYYCNDPAGHSCSFSDFAVGLDDCISFEMAKVLNLFKFDFYNDWINGTLFSFLLKYKKKRKGREVFCEYDCKDFASDPNYTGVDGNQNNVGDNNCFNNMLLDSCFTSSSQKDAQNEFKEVSGIREGLVKKVNDKLYYAATTHNTNYKLFATDIISLGSVFECDWQGIPKINDLLVPSTYKIPPDIQELAEDNTSLETCGMVDIDGKTRGLFFSIDCIGIHTNAVQSNNLRHICEIGVDIDQAEEDSNGNITSEADCVIGSNDIDDVNGKWFRDVFLGLNTGNTTQSSLSIPSPNGYSSNFNTNNTLSYYNFTSTSDNGADYINFRGIMTDSAYSQSKHSYFFYFGLIPGRTALDKMNQRFFTTCTQSAFRTLVIQSETTMAIGSNGSITFNVIGGTNPYTYIINGVGATSYGPITGITNSSVIISGLTSGTYLITAEDAFGYIVSKTVVVSGPPQLYCVASVTSNASSSVSNDGKITISTIGGGIGPYVIELLDSSNNIVGGPITNPTLPYTFAGLPIDNNIGYSTSVGDSLGNTCSTNNLKIQGPNALMFVPSAKTITNNLCYGDNSGSITLGITNGGTPPLTILTTGPAGYTSNSLNMTGLISGTYVTSVVDSSPIPVSISDTNTIVDLSQQMVLSQVPQSTLNKQCDPTQYVIPFMVLAGASGASVNIKYMIDFGTWSSPISLPYVNSSTPVVLNIPSTTSINNNIKIVMVNPNGCESNQLNILASAISLPATWLTLSMGNIPQQCTPLQANFNISISPTNRAPYTINYTITTSGGGSGSIVTSNLNNAMSLSVPSGSAYPNTANILLSVTDSKGCVSPSISQNIQVPSSLLTCNVTTGAFISVGPNAGKYPHVVTGTGGIPPYVGTGTFYDFNSTYTTTITDSQGCSATATG